jgi:hypothetical protein
MKGWLSSTGLDGLLVYFVGNPKSYSKHGNLYAMHGQRNLSPGPFGNAARLDPAYAGMFSRTSALMKVATRGGQD